MSGIQPGDVIADRYRIAELLGSGGMARVYRADDLDLGRSVAIKVLSSRYARDPAFVDRFRREASAAAKLNHPNIVQVFDRGAAQGTYYIVMEYLPGPDLKDIIRRRGTIGPDETVEAGLQILAALAVAHRHNVVHRDIKPQNVIMADDGLLKVTDFGIAQAGNDSDLTEAGSVIGTAQYLSPEQAQGGEITPASDCYSVGIVLYEMLTGRVPFDGERPVTVAMKQVNEPPVPPHVFAPDTPLALEKVILKAMAKRPADRYRSAEDFSAALMAVRNALDAEDATSVLGAVPGGTGDATRVMPATPHARDTQATRVTPQAAPPRRVEAAPPPAPPGRRWGPIAIGALAVLLLLLGGFMLLNRGDTAEAATVPSGLVGATEQQARTEITNAGLRADVRSVTSTAQQKGTVLRTNPDGGAEVAKGSVVVVEVGAGPATTSVPDVVNQKAADAVQAIEAAGFVATKKEAFDETVPAGTVISQSPAAGTQAPAGSQVVLTVSKGVEPVKVPSLRGKSLNTAISLLKAAELNYSVSERPSEKAPGTVLEQNPAATANAKKGDTVELIVASGPQQVSVPGVVGNSQSSATDKLVGAGFEVAVNTAASSEPQGVVIDQSPGSGEQVDAGSTITITVSDGPAVQPTTTAATQPAPPPAAPVDSVATTPGAAPPAPGGN